MKINVSACTALFIVFKCFQIGKLFKLILHLDDTTETGHDEHQLRYVVCRETAQCWWLIYNRNGTE